MNENKIKTCTDEQLPRMAGEVLGNAILDTLPDTSNFCDACVHWKGEIERNCDKRCLKLEDFTSTVPCTGDKAWDNAEKWRDWTVEKYGTMAFIEALAFLGIRDMHELVKAKPHHYIRTACLCHERGK